jgi:hypothetical protein
MKSQIRKHDDAATCERGSTLPLVLVLVITIAVSGAAVLSAQTSTMTAQKVWQDRGSIDSKADGALAAVTNILRYDPTRGRVNNGSACQTPSPSALPTSSSGWDNVEPIYENANAHVYVKCMAGVDSGKLLNDASEVPPYTVLTIGGGTSRGNAVGNPAGSDPTSPFCYDQGTSGTSKCEPGMYLGPGVAGASDDAETGGLQVAGNGSDSDAVLRSNSNIAIKTGNAVRELNASGNVIVRGKCDNKTTAHNYDLAATPPKTAGCDLYQTADYGAPLDIPDYEHRTLPETGWQNQDAVVQHMLLTVNDATKGCAYYNNFFAFGPGIYTDVTSLTALTNTCGGMFWFRPGVYLFDFSWNSGDHADWHNPPRSDSQVIAGSPNGWTPPTMTSAFSAPGSACATWRSVHPGSWNYQCGWVTGTSDHQTDKQMRPNRTALTGWSTTDDVTNAQVIDGASVSVNRNDNQIAKLQLDDWITPVPSNATNINKTNVKMHLAYGTHDPNNFAWGYPRLRLNVANGYADCWIALPNNYQSAANGMTINEVEIGGGGTVASPAGDIASLCTANNGAAPQNPNYLCPAEPATITRPCALNVAAAGNDKPMWKDNSIPFSAWTPAMLNTNLKAEFLVKAKAGENAQAVIDGARVYVEYDGRGAPGYPDGCSRTDPGVQFILGGQSQITWASQNVYVDICAGSATEDNPYGIAIYGVPEAQATAVSTRESTTDFTMTVDPTATITTAGWANTAGGTLTYVTAGKHGLSVGDIISIDGNLNTGYDKSAAKIASLPTQKSFTITGTGATPGAWAGGGVVNLTGTPVTMGIATWSAANNGTFTYTTSGNHGFAKGQLVTVSGMSLPGFNIAAAKVITSTPSLTTFTLTNMGASPGGVAAGGTALGYARNWQPTSAAAATAFDAAGDGKYLHLTWPKTRTASVTLTLPNNVVPAGALVQSMEVRLAHAETGSSANRIRIGIEPSTYTGAAEWDSDAWTSMPAGAPAITKYDPTGGTGGLLPTSGNPTYRWYSSGSYTHVTDPTVDGTAQGGCAGSTCLNGNWPWQSRMMRAVQGTDGTFAAINSAKLTISFVGSGTDGPANEALLDAVKVIVKYRPVPVAGTNVSVRPLRGCTSTRPASDPLQMGYRGVDYDWGASFTNGAWTNDGPYLGTDSSSNTAIEDTRACAMLHMDGRTGIRFHVQGSIFAPTGAIDLRGNDNDANLVSGSTIARTLSTFRWKNSGTIPAFGDTGGLPRHDRKVYLRAYDTKGTDTTADDEVIATQQVSIRDTGGAGVAGSLVEVDWHIRRKDHE